MYNISSKLSQFQKLEHPTTCNLSVLLDPIEFLLPLETLCISETTVETSLNLKCFEGVYSSKDLGRNYVLKCPT